MNSHARKGEEGRIWFRSDRVFLLQPDSWFFRTREGIEIGPYETRFEAEIEAGLLKGLLQNAGSHDACQAIVEEFITDGLAMGHELAPLQATAVAR